MQEHLLIETDMKHIVSCADLKGDNVMVNLDGGVWMARLMDLGMARRAAPGAGAHALPLRIRGYAGFCGLQGGPADGKGRVECPSCATAHALPAAKSKGCCTICCMKGWLVAAHALGTDRLP